MVLLRGHTEYETLTGDFKVYIWLCANTGATEQGVAFLTKYQAPCSYLNKYFFESRALTAIDKPLNISYRCRACIE